MSTVYKYRIYCETDNKWEETWGTVPPTTCPTNTSHTVNANSVSEMEKVSTSETVIKEVEVPIGAQNIGGYYRITSHGLDAPGNTTTTSTFSFPFPVAILSGYLTSTDEMKGDRVSVGAAYDTTLGVLTADAKTNDTVITITPSAVVNPYMRIGGYVRLTDGAQATAYSQIVSKNTSNSTVTLKTPLTYDFNASSPTYVQIAVVFADSVEFGSADKYDMGAHNIGGTYVPANLTFRITYVNNTATAKRPILVFDYYY